MTSRQSLSRRQVLAIACSLSMITYLDRVCFGAAVPFLVRDLDLKNGIADLKWAFTAFTLAYASFEIPSGWLGDVFGPRATLIRIVLGWSLFTVLTGLVGLQIGPYTFGGLTLLCVIRFLFGMGEAGAYPNLARVVANWFPSEGRGRAKGWIWMTGRCMGGLTPLVWTVLVVGTGTTAPLVSWRAAFLLFGLIGLAWCAVVARYFQDYPPSDGPADVRPAQDGHRYAMPWHAMLTSRNLWLLGAMYACASFSWYFNITYFPSFLETRYGLAPDSITAGVLKGGPLLLGGFGCLIGGYWTDRLLRKLGSRRWARRIPPLVGHGACGVCYLVAVFAGSAWTAALAISLAAFANDLMMGAAWASCQDIGRRHTAVTAGWMNTCGNLGGAFSGWAIGTILEQAPAGRAAAGNTLDRQASLSIGYEICLYSFAAVSFVAMFIWFGIRADQPLADD